MFIDFLTGDVSSPNRVHYLSINQLLVYEEVVQSLFLSNMCLHDVFSLVLTESYANQILGSN